MFQKAKEGGRNERYTSQYDPRTGQEAAMNAPDEDWQQPKPKREKVDVLDAILGKEPKKKKRKKNKEVSKAGTQAPAKSEGADTEGAEAPEKAADQDQEANAAQAEGDPADYGVQFKHTQQLRRKIRMIRNASLGDKNIQFEKYQ